MLVQEKYTEGLIIRKKINAFSNDSEKKTQIVDRGFIKQCIKQMECRNIASQHEKRISKKFHAFYCLMCVSDGLL